MRLVPCTVACWFVASLCPAQQAPPASLPDAHAAAVAKEPPSPIAASPDHPGSDTAPVGTNPFGDPAGEPRTKSMPVPEPSTLFLVGTGLVGLALTVRRRTRRAD